MNAGGRVPCRCGATLVLEPPRERPPGPLGGGSLDIVTLGYAITVERQIGLFDDLRQGMRATMGLESGAPGVPDPAKASDPALLWPALGLAFDPARFLPVAALLLAAMSMRWVPAVGPRLWALAGPALAAVATAVAAAVAITWVAASTHEMIADGLRVSAMDGLRALGRRRALAIGGARDAALRTALATLLGACVAMLAGLEPVGGLTALASRASAPVQVLLVVVALALLLGVIHRLLAYAAVMPRAQGMLMVQAAVEVRRVAGDRELVPSRTLVPALAASLGFGVALAGAVWLVLTVWTALVGAPGWSLPRALGRDLIVALAGGLWCAYAGVGGLLAGYTLGSGVSHEPVRAPEIITGTWGAGMRPPLKTLRDEQQTKREK
jgi:hypothetical protein